VHGKGSQLTWGLSEDQREGCARLFGQESREEGETEVACPSLGPERGSEERGRAYP
jgi:hypothetical protein